MSNFLDDIPAWIKTPTRPSDPLDGLKILDEINYLKGAYMGHSSRIAELEQQVDIAIAYERERIAKYLEARVMPSTASIVRESEGK